MAKRKHAYIDLNLNPKQLGQLKAGHVVHKQLRGYENRVAISVKHPLDKEISYHKRVLANLLKKRRNGSSVTKKVRGKWSAKSRAKLSASMKAAHKRKPNWTGK